ncbi:hypothetical protein JCM16163A_41410 [Paenibacillus sp. YK5]
MILSHLDLAKEWDRRGNRRMVRAIVNSFKRLERMRRRQTDSQSVGVK